MWNGVSHVTAGGLTLADPAVPIRSRDIPDGDPFSWSKKVNPLRVSNARISFAAKVNSNPKPAAASASRRVNVILLFPGVWHRYRPDVDVGWDEYWISFNGSASTAWSDTSFSPSGARS